MTMVKEPIYFQSKEYAEYRFLSNFQLSPIEMECPWWTHDGEVHVFASVEHYYQACKAALEEDYFKIKYAATPLEAKQLGSKVQMNGMWEHYSHGRFMHKECVMLDGLYAKFEQHADLREKLLATGNRPLYEYAPWGDTYWGVDKEFNGRNMLGVMLMQVRAVLGGRK
jgi:ribA/ribD-fused uncharacterized protein